MIIPHLIFAHLIADYVLQTDWLAVSKANFDFRNRQTWGGLILHGFMVWFVSLAVLPDYIDILWPYITIMAIVHTTQDGFKAWISRTVRVHPAVPYMLDQLCHLLTIVVLQIVVGSRVVPAPDRPEIKIMLLGASLVAVTRFYEVTWWANWTDMHTYIRRWWVWTYLERVIILLLSAVNLWLLAPLVVLPRLVVARQRGEPVWRQKHGVFELLLGMTFSVILGLAIF